MCATQPTLTSSEREFFDLVAQAVFANPFSDRRREIDERLLGDRGGTAGVDERAMLLQARVKEVLARLDRRRLATLDDMPADQREAAKIVFLFETYHSWFNGLEQLVADQLRAGDEPCPVPFARETIAHLRARGFDEDGAVRYFALLYQLRRAYHFIDSGLTGRSRAMKALRGQLWNSVISHDIRWYDRFLMDRMEDFSTLLLGETGAGKGAAARAIGRAGLIPFDASRGRFVESFTRAFLSINLSQFSELLIESELFGHSKGAFTGAVDEYDGVFARCSPHGAILLDEIGEVGASIQIKLLQVLQEREFTPVGARARKRFSGRVIAATNRPLAELRESVLRDDFFYRLSSNIITVPSLRARLDEDPAELDVLLESTLSRMAGDEASTLVDRVRTRIGECLPPDYAWPGNVRELEQCVRRILLTNEYRPASAVNEGGTRQLASRLEAGEFTASDLLREYCRVLYECCGTLAEVARRTSLDRRTVKKYLEEAGASSSRDGSSESDH